MTFNLSTMQKWFPLFLRFCLRMRFILYYLKDKKLYHPWQDLKDILVATLLSLNQLIVLPDIFCSTSHIKDVTAALWDYNKFGAWSRVDAVIICFLLLWVINDVILSCRVIHLPFLPMLIMDFLWQVLVNYARSSKEAEEVCKEVSGSVI